MSHVVRYEIIRESSPAELSVEVETFCLQGWVPIGGVAFDPTSNLPYMQAMVIYGELGE